MRAFSTRNDSPTTASRPYDADRDGFVLSEGAGILILEEYEHARARGAEIICEVLSCGMSGDTYDFVAPDPDLPPLNLPTEHVHTELRTALSNSFSFGGHNSSLVLRAV